MELKAERRPKIGKFETGLLCALYCFLVGFQNLAMMVVSKLYYSDKHGLNLENLRGLTLRILNPKVG